MAVSSAERQRYRIKPGDSFVKLFDRGVGRDMTEEALQEMINRTLGGQIPQVVRDSNFPPREFRRKSAVFKQLLEQGIIRVGPSHVAKKNRSDGFSFHLERRAKDKYIQLNLDPFVEYKAPQLTNPLPEDSPITELFQSGERRAELILVSSVVAVTTFYQNLHRHLAVKNRSTTA